MKILFEIPPASDQHRLSASRYQVTRWNKNAVDAFTAILSVTLYVGGFFVWPVKPVVKEVIESPLMHVALFFAIGIATLIFHEVLHLAASPGGLLSKNNAMGVIPKKFMCFAHCPESTSWGRTLVMLFTPVTVLTLIPVAIQFTVGLPSGWLGFMAIANASFAANDVIIGLYILFFIPRKAVDVQPNINGVSYAI